MWLVCRTLQRAFGNLAGVDDAAVNFATGRLNVHYDSNLTDVNAFEIAVTKAGYVLEPMPDQQSAQLRRNAEFERDQAESDEHRSWLVRTAVAWPLGLATMGLAFPVPAGNEDPALRWAQLAPSSRTCSRRSGTTSPPFRWLLWPPQPRDRGGGHGRLQRQRGR